MPPRNRFISGIRPLTSEDMTTLLAPVHRGTVASPDRIRQSHHRVALLIAAGHRPGEVAKRCGYTLAYLSTLTAAPAIKELVARYAEKIMANAIDDAVEEMAVGQSVLAMAQRQRLERLEDADVTGERIPLRELNAICADGEDRYGTPRKSTNFNLNANFAEELEKALARSAQVASPAPATIEGQATPVETQPAPLGHPVDVPEPLKGLTNVSPFRRRI